MSLLHFDISTQLQMVACWNNEKIENFNRPKNVYIIIYYIRLSVCLSVFPSFRPYVIRSAFLYKVCTTERLVYNTGLKRNDSHTQKCVISILAKSHFFCLSEFVDLVLFPRGALKWPTSMDNYKAKLTN